MQEAHAASRPRGGDGMGCLENGAGLDVERSAGAAREVRRGLPGSGWRPGAETSPSTDR